MRIPAGPSSYTVFPVFLVVAVTAVSSARIGAAEPVRLSLAEYVDRVVLRNHALAASRLAAEVSVLELEREEAVFEPELVGSASRHRTERLNNVEQSVNQGNRLFVERKDGGSAGVEGVLPFGTQYRVGVTLDDRANNLTTTTSPEPFEQEYQAFSGVSLTQPLLRNAGTAATKAKIRLARLEARVQQQQLRRQFMAVLSQAESAYWDLFFAQRARDMQLESVRTAERIVEDNRERVAAGKMSELEVLQAEAGLALRRSQRSAAEEDLVAAANRLRTFLSEGGITVAAAIVATDSPVEREQDVDPVESLRCAVRRQPDYLMQLHVIDQEEVRLVYARNQVWPALDLVASYGLNGLGATPDEAVQDVGRRDYEAWSVGVELRLALGGNRRRRSELAAAKLRRRQALLALKAIEIELANAVSSIVRRVVSSRDQIEGYRAVVAFNEKLLASELSKLSEGKSDSRKVLAIEADLIEARTTLIESLVDHRKAWLELELAEGSLLQSRGLEPVASVEHSRGRGL